VSAFAITFGPRFLNFELGTLNWEVGHGAPFRGAVSTALRGGRSGWKVSGPIDSMPVWEAVA
jgi:hypothetical protein